MATLKKTNTTKMILIADDEPSIREILTIILEDAGYETMISKGSDMIDITHKHLPDLILLDISMKDVDGSELCKELKKHAATKHIPIMILSAHHATPQIATECGADTFLAKPFGLDDLLAHVAKYTV